jgi:hypothetical protein
MGLKHSNKDKPLGLPRPVDGSCVDNEQTITTLSQETILKIQELKNWYTDILNTTVILLRS